jgi:putative membrane protein
MPQLAAFFSESDLRRIDAAVRDAEARSRGEIVVVAAPASGDYPGAAWTGACLGALGSLLALVLVHWLGDFWGVGSPLWTLLAAAGGAGGGYLAAAGSNSLKRLLVPDAVLERQVDLAARAAFLDHEVFATRDRSGVLLYLSLFEHRVEVLADSGVEAVVELGEWDAIVAGIVRGIKEGRATDALLEAIGRCGEILDRRGLERRGDDADELANRLRWQAGEGEGPAGSGDSEEE